MKKLIVIFLLVFASSGYSQSKLPTKNAVWKYCEYNCQDGKLYSTVYSLTGINKTNDTLNYTISGYGVYHFVSVKDRWMLRTDTGLFTLFDYNAKINDTLILYRTDWTNLYGLVYKVKSIDSVDISNMKIAKITIVVINTISGFGKPFEEVSLNEILGIEESYLSRIGSTRSFIPLLPFLATTCDLPNLSAYKDEGVNYEISRCETITKINTSDLIIDDETIPIKEYLIYNTLGIQINSGSGNEQYKYDLNRLLSGLYIVLFFNENKHTKTLKILK